MKTILKIPVDKRHCTLCKEAYKAMKEKNFTGVIIVTKYKGDNQYHLHYPKDLKQFNDINDFYKLLK